MPDYGPIDGETLLAYMREVANELPMEGDRRPLVVVGGARLAWLGLRDATRDIDTVSSIDEVLRHAVEVVAARHNLAPNWVNAIAAPFAPSGRDVERRVAAAFGLEDSARSAPSNA